MKYMQKEIIFWYLVLLPIFVVSILFAVSMETCLAEDAANGGDSHEFLSTLTPEEKAWMQTHPVIRVVQDPSWPPVEFVDERGEPSGMSREYLNLVEERLGVQFESVRASSWGEAYTDLKRWEIDMTTSVSMTPQRAEFWALTRPYLTIPIVIATQSNVSFVADIRELAHKKVAVVAGYAVEDWVGRDYPKIQLVRAKSTLEGLEMLQRGEVFAYLDNLLIIGDYQAKMKVTNIKIAGQTPYVNAQCMAVRKDWAPLAGILEKALDSISETERKEIYRKWLPVRYEHGFDYVLFSKVMAVFAVILVVMIVWNRQLTREIRSRKKAEEALRESEMQQRRYISGAPYGVFVADEHARFLQVNPAMSRITGYNEEELLEMGISDVYFDEDVEEGLRCFQTIELWGEAQDELVFRPKNGVRRWWSVTAVMITETRFLGFCSDITERKDAEKKILETNALLNSVLEGTTDAIFVKDMDGRYLLVNSGACNAVGKAAKDILGRSDNELFPVESATVINEVDQKVIATGTTVLAEEKLETTDGTTFWLVNKSPYYNDSHEVKGLIGISHNITLIKKVREEKAKLQKQLNQVQKMESIGQLAGGVAHDFNNMLGVILGHSEMAMEQEDLSPSLHVSLQEIHKAATRSANITRQLLAFARKQAIAPQVLDFNESVEEILEMLRHLIGEDINLTWLPGKDLWPIKTDSSQINQILVNLCVNARDAIAGVGQLTIETNNCTLDDDYCARNAGFTPGQYVRCIVSDNGQGMDKETLSHIFEPFFTTKHVGKGTGLGLATVYGTVKQNNGFINVYSESGQGAIFSIYLPRYVGDNGHMQSEYVSNHAIGGDETILLVEDEPTILKMTTKLLESLGYDVLAIGTPEEAIQLVGERVDEIHLLLTDVIMPEMNGRDMAEKLLSIYPHLRCLFMSGYTSDVMVLRGILDEGVGFIQKPFSKRELASKVRSILEQH